jgi:hypothetical protein
MSCFIPQNSLNITSHFIIISMFQRLIILAAASYLTDVCLSRPHIWSYPLGNSKQYLRTLLLSTTKYTPSKKMGLDSIGAYIAHLTMGLTW